MSLLPDSLIAGGWVQWQGRRIGRAFRDPYYLGDAIKGLATPMHRMPSADRLAGGASGGLAVRGSAQIEVDAWCESVEDHLWLQASMEARADGRDVLPLAWKGLGWGDREVCRFVRPLGFDADADEEADDPDRPDIGLRLMWTADDPTVYSATEHAWATVTARTAQSTTWTNPGLWRPTPGMGGRAWVSQVTTTTAMTSPFIEMEAEGFPVQRVSFPGLAIPSGSVFRVDSRRQAWIGTSCVTGHARSNGTPFLDWPSFPPGVEAELRFGASWGTFQAAAQFRGTW